MQLTVLARLSLAVALTCPALCTAQSAETNTNANTNINDSSVAFDDKAAMRIDGSVQPPSKDPFYEVPFLAEGVARGHILRVRRPPSEVAAFGIALDRRYLSDAYQVLYRTTDKEQKATATVMTVFIPPNADFEKVIVVVAAEDASSIDCAPSFSFLIASNSYPNLTSPSIQLQALLNEDFLNRGWIVVVPDAAGPKGAYPTDEVGAYATLDAMRAAINSGPFTGVSRRAKFALWGYSGGASTALGALQAQPSYGAELKIVAAALGCGGGDLPALSSAFALLNKSFDASFIVLNLVGQAAKDAKFARQLEQHVKPEFRQHFYAIKSLCLDSMLREYSHQDILAMFEPSSFVAGLEFPQPSYINVAPTVPIYMFQASHDLLIRPEWTQAAAHRLCSQGAKIQYVLDTVVNISHLSYTLFGTERSTDWLAGYLDGTSQPLTQCVNETIETSQVPSAFLNLFSPAIQRLMQEFVERSPAFV